MYTLFISTYDKLVTIGLLKNGLEVLKEEKESLNGHSVVIVPLIQKILKEKNLNISELNEIIVVNGPGSFTGVRLGVTVAKTLAYTLKISIKTITSLEALSCSIDNPNKIIVIDDPKGHYIGKFINNKVEELIYIKNEEADTYFKNYSMFTVYQDELKLNLEYIYKYCQNIKETPAHNVKACYIKGIDILNGK